MKPIEAVSWKRTMSMSATPGGALGCTSTGSAASSIACHTGAYSGSVRWRPSMLASTITPTAPIACARFNSTTALAGYCHGRVANQWMRPAYLVCASLKVSFIIAAVLLLTASPPQNTLGQVSEMIETSMPAESIMRMRAS